MKICISGLGKAGSQTARYLLKRNDVQLVSGVCSPHSKKAGKDIGEAIGCGRTWMPVYSSDNLAGCIHETAPDVVIDFSTPSAAVKNAELFSRMNVKIVMATTGFSPEEEKKLFRCVKKHKNGMVYAPNITKGVNVLMVLTDIATRILGDYDTEIIEMHHRNKKDIPSGTAKKIAAGIKSGKTSFGVDSGDTVPIASVRAGGIVGYHRVMMAGDNDKVEILHESFSRDSFAEGALEAAKFVCGKSGIFEMRDVLDLNHVIESYLNEKNMPLNENKIPTVNNVVPLSSQIMHETLALKE